MRRSLKEYALAAEIIGAIAVVISLIYVGTSVNQNTNATMVANHHALVAMDQNTNSWFRDPEFAAIFESAMTDASTLSSVQLRQFRTFAADKFNAWEFAFLTHNNGMMEDNIWDGWDAYYRLELEQNAHQWYWNTGREGYSPAFRTYVDSILAEIE
ncbi:MAG: hypothetical protein ACI9UU_003226 [Candidatus Azotimanducaceae bacterium]